MPNDEVASVISLLRSASLKDANGCYISGSLVLRTSNGHECCSHGLGKPSQLEIIVILVSADPEPIITTFPLARERAIAATDLGGINAAFLAEALKRDAADFL